MDASKGSRAKKGTGPLGVCPYLGVQDDPATHFAWAKPGHFCYRIRPAQPIAPQHQENYCLNGRYPTCVVYPASWKGALPPGVRDDAYSERSRRAVGIKSPDTSAAKGQDEVEKSTSRFGMDLASLRDQSDFIEEEPLPIPWWKRRSGIILLAALVIFPILILSVWAIVNSSRAQGESATPLTGNLSAPLDLTATWQAGQMVLQQDSPTPELPTPAPPTYTPTFEPTVTDTPRPTQILSSPTSIIGVASISATTNPTPLLPNTTATLNPYTCQERGAYVYELGSGPLLNPEAGTDYRSGDMPLTVSSSWQVKNTSSCTWNSIVLLSIASNRLLMPYINLDGTVFIPESPEQNLSIAPGEQITVGLGFPLYMARGIRGEWALVINGFRLVEQPHLKLDVTNWIIGIEPKATQRTSDRPPGSRNDSEPPTPPSIRP